MKTILEKGQGIWLYNKNVYNMKHIDTSLVHFDISNKTIEFDNDDLIIIEADAKFPNVSYHCFYNFNEPVKYKGENVWCYGFNIEK